MTWSSAFMEALGGKVVHLDYLLRRIWSPDATGHIASVDLIASRPGLARLSGIIGQPRLGASGITPVTWKPILPTWELAMPTLVLSTVLEYLPRGAICQLLGGIPGMAADEFCPLALGRVHSVVVRGAVTTVRFMGPESILSSRLSTDPSSVNLFYDVNNYTTLSADYTAGEPTISYTNDVFQRETGGSGLVLLEPAGGTPFYLTYTGNAGGQLTGVSALGALGSTEDDCLAGAVIRNVAYIHGHPFTTARKLLMSGGGGSTYDTLPTSWGFAVPSDLFDNDDIDQWETFVAATGGTVWDFISLTEVEGGWPWVANNLSQGGLWLTQRRGLLTFRAIQDPDSSTYYADTITESDLVQADAWSMEILDPQVAEYGGVYAECSGASQGAYSGYCETAPIAAKGLFYDLSAVVFENSADQMLEVVGRTTQWSTRPPEVLTLLCAGLRMSGLCPGDRVLLDLPHVRGRVTALGHRQYLDWPATICEVAPDLGAHITRLRAWPARETTS